MAPEANPFSDSTHHRNLRRGLSVLPLLVLLLLLLLELLPLGTIAPATANVAGCGCNIGWCWPSPPVPDPLTCCCCCCCWSTVTVPLAPWCCCWSLSFCWFFSFLSGDLKNFLIAAVTLSLDRDDILLLLRLLLHYITDFFLMDRMKMDGPNWWCLQLLDRNSTLPSQCSTPQTNWFWKRPLKQIRLLFSGDPRFSVYFYRCYYFRWLLLLLFWAISREPFTLYVVQVLVVSFPVRPSKMFIGFPFAAAVFPISSSMAVQVFTLRSLVLYSGNWCMCVSLWPFVTMRDNKSTEWLHVLESSEVRFNDGIFDVLAPLWKYKREKNRRR